MELSTLLQFTRFTHNFQQVKRSIYATGEDRMENDAEHSYQLALVAWYIISAKKIDLNIDLVIKYAIAHDLVETYAGDTPNFGAGVEMKKDKAVREAQALERLHSEFPECKEIFDLIEQYEERKDNESKFVYALDKLISPLNIYLDQGASWFKNNVTIEEMIGNKRPRISEDDQILKLFDQLVDRLRKDEDKLFPKK